jgi:Mrp family chromosome partitioning ATPase
LKPTLAKIGHVFVVLSGKGGVGKSTVTANIALGLAARGQRVGVLDIDVHGPSIPKILGVQGERAMGDGEKLIPAETASGVKVMSTALILEKPDDPIVWRGPLKAGVIKQFIGEVAWGELDYLIVDCPPGTGDEPLSICQLIPDADGAVIVTTPQQVATLDVSKSVTFCNQLGMRIAGIVENMSGFTCPHCGEFTPIFRTGGGEQLAKDYGLPFLGKLPIATEIGEAGDAGEPFVTKYPDSPAAKAFLAIVDNLMSIGLRIAYDKVDFIGYVVSDNGWFAGCGGCPS